MSQITPAYFPKEGRAEFNSGYKSMIGAFRKISSYYFTASRSFRKQNGKVHTGRVQFYNEKEGSYISTPRFYANYGYSLPIGEEVDLFSGVAIGASGIYYSAPTTSQSSFTLPDGSIGIGVRAPWIEVGGSVLQMFNASYAPIASKVTFGRFYHLYASAQKEWPSEWKLKGYLMYRHLPFLLPELFCTLSFAYRENVELGATLKSQSGLSVFALLGVETGEDRIQIMLNYNSPFLGRMPSWQSNVEVGLSYSLD